jgi:hypothetical protein
MQPHFRRGCGLRLQAFCFPTSRQQRIDVSAGALRQLVRPVLPRIEFGLFIAGDSGSAGEPGPDRGDFFRLQRRSFGRHSFAFTRCHAGEQDRASGSNHVAAVAALAHPRDRIEPQGCFLLQSTVTGIATRLEERLDVVQIIHLSAQFARAQPERGGHSTRHDHR